MLTRRSGGMGVLAMAGTLAAAGVQAQVTVTDAIIITEFYDHFNLVDPSIPLAQPIYLNPSSTTGANLANSLLLEPSGTLLYSNASALRRLDPATGIMTQVVEFGGGGNSIYSIAMEADGSVIAVVGTASMYRINPATGQATLLPPADPSRYWPKKVTVAPDGDIYLTEFYEKLLKLDPVTLQFSPVPNGLDLRNVKALEALPTGELAIIDLYDQLYRLNPDTGVSTFVPFDPGTSSIRGTAVATNGNLLLATDEVVLEIDLQTGSSVLLAPNVSFFVPFDVVQGTLQIFFDPVEDVDVDDSDLGTAFANYTGPVGAAGGKTYLQGDVDGDGDVDDSDLGSLFANYSGPLAPASVPEPTSLALLGVGGLFLSRRRRG